MAKSKISTLNESCLLYILRQLPLRKALQLRHVCREWKRVIETKICHLKRSLKVFGSLKAILDYYQFVNRDYHRQAQKKSHFYGSDFRDLEDIRLAIRDYRGYFPRSVGGHFLNFSLASEPEDDHLIVSNANHLFCLFIRQLFPALDHFVLYQVCISPENSIRRLAQLLGMAKSVELYHRLNGPGDSKIDDSAIVSDILFASYVITNSANSTQAEEASPLRNHFMAQFRNFFPSLQCLVLDGGMINRYKLLDMLFSLSTTMKSNLHELKLFQIDEKDIMTNPILGSVEKSAFTQTLTRLTLYSVTYDVLIFFCKNFINITFLDIDVIPGLKSYDVLACLTNLSCLEELRLRSSEPDFFIPLQLNKIFSPFITVKRLHLFLADLSVDKLVFLTDRLFPSVDKFVLDVGQLTCNCDCKQSTTETPELAELTMPQLLDCIPSNSKVDMPDKFVPIDSIDINGGLQACVECFPHIRKQLQKCSLFTKKKKIYLYLGYKVEYMFFRLQQKYFCLYKDKLNQINVAKQVTRELTDPRPTIMERFLDQIQNLRPSRRRRRRHRGNYNFGQTHREIARFQYFDQWNDEIDVNLSESEDENDDIDSVFNERIVQYLDHLN